MLKQAERPATTRAVERVFTAPIWTLVTAALVATYLRLGIDETRGARFHIVPILDPFNKPSDVPAWLYESPVEPLLGWALRVRTIEQLRLLSAVIAVAALYGCAYMVGRCVSQFAGRLFVFGWFCSYQGTVWLTQLGAPGDVINVAALTAVMVVSAPAAAFTVAVLLGFNHFEQAAIAVAAAVVFRRHILNQPPPMKALAFGLVVGKVLNFAYLHAAGIPSMGRFEFIRTVGVGNLVDGWKGQLAELIFSCYLVAWFAVVAMFTRLDRRRGLILVGLQVVATLPVLLTYDLSRVYGILTWPILVGTVVWWSQQPDRDAVQRVALWLAVAACFVPVVNVWHATGAGLDQFFR